MAESKESVKFMMTMDADTFRKLQLKAVKKSEPGQQKTVQDMLREIAEKDVSKTS